MSIFCPSWCLWPDDLNLWRAYAPQDGVCIGFSVEELQKLAEHQGYACGYARYYSAYYGAYYGACYFADWFDEQLRELCIRSVSSERLEGWIPAINAGMTVVGAAAAVSLHARRHLWLGKSEQTTHPVIPGLVPGIQGSAYSAPSEFCMRRFWVYILASGPRGTLYIGITNGVIRRVDEHRAGTGSAFTRRYCVHRLVWFEEFADVRQAIQREKTLKEWPRDWKLNLIERANPNWIDLYPSLPGVAPPRKL